MTKITGKELRDEGMVLASEAEERDNIGWSNRAFAAIVALARVKDEIHANDLNGFERPKHHNAWGSVWTRAINDGIIEWNGALRKASAPQKHARLYRVYRSLIRKL